MSFASQISNRNFLSPGGFRFSLGKFPKVSYLAQQANIPQINMGLVQQDTPYRPAFVDGNLEYGSFTLQFLVDEDLENYLIIHNWMRGLGVPDSFKDRQDFESGIETNLPAKEIGDLLFADGTLTVLNSNFQPNFNVVFKDLKPTSLSTLEFDATIDSQEFFQAVVTFDYLSYEIQGLTGTRKTTLK